MKDFKLARIDDVKKVELIDWPMPELEKDEVKVKIVACGICTSDQGIFTAARGKRFPFFPGHEVVGIVEEIGEHAQGVVEVGDHVAISRMHRCGMCKSCRRGGNNRCLNRHKLYREGRPAGQGGMAEYLVVPSYQIHKLTQEVDMQSAALLEPVACCIASVEKGDVLFGDTVLVVGAGIMGLLHADLLRLKGAKVIISEFDPVRREFAKDHADVVLDASQDISKEIMEITDGYGVNQVFLTAGPTELVSDLFNVVADGATFVVYTSYYQASGPMASIDLNKLHYKEYNLRGTISPTEKDFRQAIDLLLNDKIDLRPYVSETYPLTSIQEAFERALEPDAYRVVLLMDGDK